MNTYESVPAMNRKGVPDRQTLGHMTDRFMYFFLGLRKGEIRRRIATLRSHHPDESPQELARRLIAIQTPLSLVGGALLQVPVFVPAIGTPLKLLGLASGTAVMMRMHMAMLLEIAHLFDRDIDDVARVKEMVAVMAATGLTSAMPFLFKRFSLKPAYAMISGGMTASTISELVGEAAIRYYSIEKAREEALVLSSGGAGVDEAMGAVTS